MQISPSVLVSYMLVKLCALLDWRIVELLIGFFTCQENRGVDAK